jgi:hypothetical protein
MSMEWRLMLEVLQEVRKLDMQSSKKEATIVAMVQSKAGISCPMTHNISA